MTITLKQRHRFQRLKIFKLLYQGGGWSKFKDAKSSKLPQQEEIWLERITTDRILNSILVPITDLLVEWD